jgi:hypothetical protein
VDANGRPASSAPAGSVDSGPQAPGPGDTPTASGPLSIASAPPADESAGPSSAAEPSAAPAAPSTDSPPVVPSLTVAGQAVPTLPVPSASPRPAPPESTVLPYLRFDSRERELVVSTPIASDDGLEQSPDVSTGSGTYTDGTGALTIPDPSGAAGREAIPQSFVIDPTTELETRLVAPAWRPVVDPTGMFVAYWAGTLRYDATTLTWLPDRGLLVLALWSALAATDPAAILAPVPLLAPGSEPGSIGDWDIRWDESGRHIGLWTADAGDPDVGRLSLLTIDAATARVDPSSVLLESVPALAGFSIGRDRLAWATPPGQDGQGSRV